MSFAFHGNWCGPGWTAGQYKSAADATNDDFQVEAVDELDAICKRHDHYIWYAHNVLQNDAAKRRMLKRADETFTREIRNAQIPGISDNIASFMVWALGPSPNLRTVEDIDDEIDLNLGVAISSAIAEAAVGTSFFNLPDGAPTY